MKKISILFSLLLAMAVCEAQTQKLSADMVRINRLQQLATKSAYQHRMTSFVTDDNYQSSDFHYDRQGRLDAVHEKVSGEYEVTDSIYYNEQGQLVKISGFQNMGFNNWRNVYYIDYTYDQDGNLASRTNYNNIDGWQMGGIYSYSYNDNHQIVLSLLTMMDMLFQKIEYSYDNGRLKEELWYSYNGYNLAPDEKLTYVYDNNGFLTNIWDSVSDGTGWSHNGLETYVHDQYGNTTEFHRYNSARNETSRSEFEYNYDMPLSTTQIPYNPEIIRPQTFNNTHCYTTEHYWMADVNLDLQYVCDYLYNYDDYIGIPALSQPAVTVYPNPTEGHLTIEADQIANTTVFNSLGQIVATFNATNAIDLSPLPSGVYTLRVKTANGVKTQQVVRQ